MKTSGRPQHAAHAPCTLAYGGGLLMVIGFVGCWWIKGSPESERTGRRGRRAGLVYLLAKNMVTGWSNAIICRDPESESVKLPASSAEGNTDDPPLRIYTHKRQTTGEFRSRFSSPFSCDKWRREVAVIIRLSPVGSIRRSHLNSARVGPRRLDSLRPSNRT